jgi:N-acetylneuraminate lyase
MELKGIFTALHTPFDHNNKINEYALDKLIKHNIRMGVQGFYVCGSTAEAFLLSTDERKQIMEVVKASAPGCKLIAHIGSLNEAEAAKLAVHAKKLEYDAISSVAPFYYKFSFAEIKNYYFRLTQQNGMPMIVYYIPALTGVNMGTLEISEFLQHDDFIGIKFTSNDYFTLEQCKSRFPDKVVFNGYDEMFLAGLSMGADGGIGSTYNFMADKFVEIKRLFEKGDITAAQEMQNQANRIITVLCDIGVMQAEKEILNQLGFDFGKCRPPFGELSDVQKHRIANEVVPFIKKESDFL